MNISELNFTANQIELMKHAIGLDSSKLKKSTYIPYRNYLLFNGKHVDCENLVSNGVLNETHIMSSDKYEYNVTEKGASLLSKLFGIKIIL